MSLSNTKPCPSCGAESALQDVGSASGRGHYHCPACGPWREKNASAVALGRNGGRATQASRSEKERSKLATELAVKRWREEKQR